MLVVLQAPKRYQNGGTFRVRSAPKLVYTRMVEQLGSIQISNRKFKCTSYLRQADRVVQS